MDALDVALITSNHLSVFIRFVISTICYDLDLYISHFGEDINISVNTAITLDILLTQLCIIVHLYHENK